jgi:hypothetical protein
VIVAATAPFSDADAGRRIYGAAKPLKAAGIPNLTALDTIATAMRSIVTAPMVNGELSTRSTARSPGTWRARKSGAAVTVEVDRWTPTDGDAVTEQAERLAGFRGLRLTGVEIRD